jgi:hypothetical protein
LTTATTPEVVRVLVGVLAQTAVVTGLLYYFGWARTASALGYFGVDSSLVHLSTSDYLLRSVGPALPPLVLGTLAIACLLFGLRLTRRAVRNRRRRLRWSVALAVQGAAAAAVAAGCYASFRPIPVHLPGPLRPLLVSVGLLLAVSGWPLLEEALRRRVSAPATVLLLIATSGAACLLWSWSLYASHVGVTRAQELVTDLPYKEPISVYSTERLAFSGPGVNALSLERTGSRYSVRYDGLRLLIRAADGSMFLVPVEWKRGRDGVFQIKDDERIRIDVVARAD